ncbi:hydrogenase/urease nickel incorporation protein HypA [Helicobacter muridarum]|uniref:Hydrogenase maturation factor HypA n=1 Tax=Helicobacter muridarum TaxID=216 RepID=A0A099U212_9HELI|nr:hydrogenase/urease maturation nickel metallochaperone HypA [Helicobacter muridarum]TLE00174.1 hydrogenase/urease nickel incorporation protein HypA [Helicobacter muridarum]STQ87018.1 hydrogenase nickel incorporation protein [Helicobacter muridarum]
MHEYSIVASLIEIMLDEVYKHNADFVSEVVVSVGERANIEKTLLVSAFDVLKTEYKSLCECKITIIMEQLLLECQDCNKSFHSLNSPDCPFCESQNTTIIAGREIRLEKLELEIS